MAGLSIEKLRDTFDCDPLTGVLTWKPRPQEAFARLGEWRTWSARFAGKRAGSLNGKGYGQVDITSNGARNCLAVHRVVWALAHGSWPLDQIDHINGDKSDNRLVNLRLATNTENQHNRRLILTQGTSFDPKTGRFRARIYVNGKNKWLGHYATLEKAHSVYLLAKLQLHPYSTFR